MGGGVVLDPFPPQLGRGLGHRALALTQTPAERLLGWVSEGALAGVATRALPVRLGIRPGDVTGVIATAGKPVLVCGDVLAGRAHIAAEAERLANVVAAHHAAHPLDRGMSLQALRATMGDVPAAVMDQVLELGVRKKLIEVEGGDVRPPGWKAAVDPAARAKLAARVAAAGWQVPTVAELQREVAAAPDVPVPLH